MNAVAATFAAALDPKELHVLALAFTTASPLGSFVFAAGGVWRRKRLFSAVGHVINRPGLQAIVVVDEALALAIRAKAAMAGTSH